ncbi:MAG: TetR family transcriptional regulator [Burkholderia sp.]|nr:TetR family transcriptional regulator [Burkholderia sp.]
MARRKADRSEADEGAAESPKIVRLVPTQKRSRERFERILACAVQLMAEKGSDAFRMSDIVERTGIAFGSLYQYFPDKTAIIGTLAERYNAIGHDCVRKELLGLRTLSDLHAVLGRITDSYYQFFIDEPAVHDIWQATQADRALQKLDEEDGAFLTGLLFDALQPLAPHLPKAALADFCQLVMVLMSAAVRHAITLPSKEGRRILASFKKMLPHDPD